MRDRRKSNRRRDAGRAAAFAVSSTPDNPDRRRTDIRPRRAPTASYSIGGDKSTSYTPFIVVAAAMLVAGILGTIISQSNTASASRNSADCTETIYRGLKFIQCTHHYPTVAADCVSINVIGRGSQFSRNQSTGFHCIPHPPKKMTALTLILASQSTNSRGEPFYADDDLHITSYEPNVKRFSSYAAAAATIADYEKNGGEEKWRIVETQRIPPQLPRQIAIAPANEIYQKIP